MWYVYLGISEKDQDFQHNLPIVLHDYFTYSKLVPAQGIEPLQLTFDGQCRSNTAESGKNWCYETDSNRRNPWASTKAPKESEKATDRLLPCTRGFINLTEGDITQRGPEGRGKTPENRK